MSDYRDRARTAVKRAVDGYAGDWVAGAGRAQKVVLDEGEPGAIIGPIASYAPVRAALDRLLALVEAEAEHSAAPHYDRECSDKFSLCWRLREAQDAIDEAGD